VCIDKTGTLTEPGMELLELISCGDGQSVMGRQVLASMVAADPRPNATLAAIGAGIGATGGHASPAGYVPFSSTRKWQGIESPTLGAWVLGAPDVLLDPSSDVARRAEAIGSQGLRAVLLGRVERLPKGDILPVVRPELLVVLDQRLRPDARATLDYFARQGVSVKVLSGDSVASVQAVARSLAIDGWDKASDARDLPPDRRGMGDALEAHSIFGRVRPEQKRAMIEALRARGHTVAMMGDGVNDVLALKMADVGVAMGSGSPATRAVAQIVLLGNAFAALPQAIAEGRRVIGNVERISNLFLSKTVYSTLLALLVGGWGLMASLLNTEPLPFPFLPRHVMLSAWFTIGIPAFILSLAPADDRARPGFVSRVLRLAIPSGAAVTLMTLTSYALASWGHGFAQAGTSAQASTAALTTLVVVMLHVLSVVSRPYQWWKIGLIAASVLTYLTIFSWPLAQSFFVLDLSSARAVATGIGCGIVGAMLVEVAWRVARLEGSRPVRE
jgi:cation-transporting ATPase E